MCARGSIRLGSSPTCKMEEVARTTAASNESFAGQSRVQGAAEAGAGTEPKKLGQSPRGHRHVPGHLAGGRSTTGEGWGHAMHLAKGEGVVDSAWQGPHRRRAVAAAGLASQPLEVHGTWPPMLSCATWPATRSRRASSRPISSPCFSTRHGGSLRWLWLWRLSVRMPARRPSELCTVQRVP